MSASHLESRAVCTRGNTIHYRVAEAHKILAWVAREGFSKEVTFTLKPEGKAGIIQLNNWQVGHQEDGKKHVKI